ncbi:unnamed protein product [Mytilus edulis]|uniref:Uncharacterized protein n=1 Tax=Mytilus edulis TaxID=6550 RepID=A0A8S3T262_MYTED|nr:unnamed protein product [Mytilus edulis]
MIDSLLKSLERGNQMVKSFVEGCSNESETHVFYSPMSWSPLNTFDDTIKTSKLKCKSGDFVKAHIKPYKFSNGRSGIAVNIGSAFIASLYDPKGKFRFLHDDLNKLRVEFAATKDASLVKIPPCENTFLQHIPSAILQSHFPKTLVGSDGCRNYLTHQAILEEDDDENDD